MAQPQLRTAQGLVRFYNFLPQGNSFLNDVLHGLSQPQKSLPSKYLYDKRGCELFEKVCALPDYYSARIEHAILRAHAGEMAKFLGEDCQLIEFGPGSSVRSRILIGELQPPLLVLVHIDEDAMRAEADGLGQMFPWLNMVGVCADYARSLTLPEFVGVPIKKKAAYFPGSNLSHFTPDEMVAVLKRTRRAVGAGGALLAGVDQNTDRMRLAAACNDVAGATAAFNLNLLARINRELGADFELRRYGHKGVCDQSKGRIELQLESLAQQLAHLGGVRLHLAQGETISTEISCGYGMEQFLALARGAGFEPGETWTDADNLFGVLGMIAV